MISARPVMDLWAAFYRMDILFDDGPTMSFRDILYLTAIASSGGCTVSELAQKAGVSKPSVTVRINSLVDKGLVTKTRSDSDRRTVRLELTELAAGILDEEESRISEFLGRLVDEHGEENVRAFLSMADELASMINNMR